MKYGIRPEYIDYLKRRGIPVETFGRGWDKSELEWREMAIVFAKSKINLSFPWVGHSQRITTLKGRDFEATMAGGLYLTGFSEELARHYRINEEIFCYNSIEECVDLIRYLLARPELCQRIRKKGQQRAMSDHTWDARFSQLLSFMGLIKCKKGVE
jgi:spore maturation protein CgeB